MTAALAQDAARFLGDGAWRTRFEEAELDLGSRLARRRAVTLAAAEWLHGDNLLLRAAVADPEQPQPREAEAVAWPERGIWQLETTCGCQQKFQCAHAAALLLSLPTEPEALQSFLLGRSAPPPRAVPLAPPPAPASVGTAPGLTPSPHLPASPPEEELDLLRAEPVFTLRIERQPLASKAAKRFHEHLGVQPAPADWLLAQVRVRYGPHHLPLLTPAEPVTRRVHDLATGQPLRLQRDAQAEHAAARQLREAGLLRLTHHPLWRRLHHGRLPEPGQLDPSSLDLAATGYEPLADPWLPEPAAHSDPRLFWAEFRRHHLPALTRSGWTVDFPASLGSRIVPADPAEWQARLDSHPSGWFSLSVGFAIDGRTHDLLPLLAHLLADHVLEETLDRPNHAPLLLPVPHSGEILEIPLGRLRRILRQLFAALHPGCGKNSRREPDSPILLHPLDAAALASGTELPLESPPELASLLQDLPPSSRATATAAEVVPPGPSPALSAAPAAPLPTGLRATLRSYQHAGLSWMQWLARHQLHGVLADDMGLGKTLQTLAHLVLEQESGRAQGRPSLVVAPTSVIPNWYAEARRFAPALKVLDATGARRHQHLPHLQHATLVLTSYALLPRDLRRLSVPDWHLVILDEAQFIKNPQSRSAQSARQLRARHRLCLSGTPIENNLGELWSLFAFLQPHYLGSQDQFAQNYRNPIEKHADLNRAADLRARVAPLILRRTKTQVATELPPKTELIHSIELAEPQKDLYEAVRASMDAQVRKALALRAAQRDRGPSSAGDNSRMLFLSALLKLRQVCCDPRLLDPPPGGQVPSAKLAYLLELLDQLLAEDSRVLLFSQFTSMLSLIQAELKQRKVPHLLLTGASQNRGQLVQQFQSGAYPIFLISLKAGGTGLNLTAADTVIHFDPWWNPAAEAQATDRAYRIGQTRPVFVHKLLCQNSVEERIHKLQRDKQALADTLLADAAQPLKLDPALLDQLLAPLG